MGRRSAAHIAEEEHVTDRETELQAALDKARAETRAAFANRALVYAAIYDELEAELGADRATELMKRAIYSRGVEIGKGYAEAVAAGDLDEVARLFVAGSPCEGAFFEPGIAESPEGGRVVLSMTACPLAETWSAAGLAPERVDLLCEIAAAVDYGTFEGAGLDLRFLDRQACPGSSACLLELTVREGGGR